MATPFVSPMPRPSPIDRGPHDKPSLRPVRASDEAALAAVADALTPPNQGSAVSYAQPHHRAAMVASPVNAPELGKVSAEAVLTQWTETAKAIETMGETLRAVASRCRDVMDEIEGDLERVAETAKAHRERGIEIAAEIERCATLTRETREAANAMTAKLSVNT